MAIVAINIMTSRKWEIAVIKAFAYAIPVHARHSMAASTISVKT
jgi:hypothetical protein